MCLDTSKTFSINSTFCNTLQENTVHIAYLHEYKAGSISNANIDHIKCFHNVVVTHYKLLKLPAF